MECLLKIWAVTKGPSTYPKVCEVEFTELISYGVFRHPSFQAMRMDKKLKEVVRESAVEAKAIVRTEMLDETETKPVHKDQHSSAIRSPESTNREALLNPKDKTVVRKVNGNELKFRFEQTLLAGR